MKNRASNPAGASPAILEPQAAQALLDLATPETAGTFKVITAWMENAAHGDAGGPPIELMQVGSRLLLLDALSQHLQLVLASTTDTLVSVMAAVPDGPLRERVGSLITYHATLPGMELRDVIQELSKVARAEALREAEKKFAPGPVH